MCSKTKVLYQDSKALLGLLYTSFASVATLARAEVAHLLHVGHKWHRQPLCAADWERGRPDNSSQGRNKAAEKEIRVVLGEGAGMQLCHQNISVCLVFCLQRKDRRALPPANLFLSMPQLHNIDKTLMWLPLDRQTCSLYQDGKTTFPMCYRV